MSVARAVPPPADATSHLGAMHLFAGLQTDVLEGIANEAEWLELRGGDVLFRQDEPSDGLYVVVAGRLRATTEDGRVIGELGRGEPVGELGLLVDEPRSATVRAVRDSLVLRIDDDAFQRLVVDAPTAMLSLTRTIARRLVDSQAGRAATSPVSAVAMISLVDRARHIELVSGLGVEVLTDADVPDEHHLARRLESAEDEGVVLLDVGAEPSEWASTCLRQADRVLVIADASARPTLARAAELLALLDASGCHPTEELVLLHGPHERMPRGTARWLGLRSFVGHHHVRRGVRADLARLTRHLQGRAVGLVLGGGGARCFAHIGAVHAMKDAGMPIDAVGGSSLGAVMAAQVATGWTADEMHESNRREWQSARINRRVTLPIVSILSLRTAVPMFDRMFGDTALEDLWLPCFVTTADLSTCELSARRRGRTALWVRASASPPGIWPPVVDEDGHLHVDGGVLDNLPVRLMRTGQVGRVATVNVSPYAAMLYDGIDPAPTTPREWLRGLRRDRRGAKTAPNILRVLYRTAIVTSLGAQAVARTASDLYVQPELAAYGLADYDRIDDIVAEGERATRDALATLAEAPAQWA